MNLVGWSQRPFDPLDILPNGASIRHHHPLSRARSTPLDLATRASWDDLRTSERRFLIPDSRAAWQALCESEVDHDSDIGDEPIAELLSLLRNFDLGPQILSFGVGLGRLEYRLKRARPELEIFCSDFSAETVLRLKGVFHECDRISEFDLATGDFEQLLAPAQPRALALLHRVDLYLTDRQWRSAFSRMHAAQMSHICFVPHRILTLRHALRVKLLEARHRSRRLPLACDGLLRTRRRLISLWADSFEIVDEPFIGRPAFLLKRRS